MAVFVTLTTTAGCSRSGLAPPPPSADFCFEVEPGSTAEAELQLTVQVERADVVLLIDNSQSMADEIRRISERLDRTVIPGIQAAIDDTEFGLAVVADFSPKPTESAYRLLTPVGGGGPLLGTSGSIGLEDGNDPQEAQLEALYQLATGEGLGTAIPPAQPCPIGRLGGACFRPDATRIVLLFTDAPMRGALTSPPETLGTPRAIRRAPSLRMAPVVPYARTIEETLAAIGALNIRVVGLWSESPAEPGRRDLVHLVEASGAVDRLGEPLVFDIGKEGETLDRDVVDAAKALVAGVRPDVFLRLEPAGDLPEGLVGAVWARALDAEAGRVAPDGTHFLGVSPGAVVRFSIDLDATDLAPEPAPRRFTLQAILEDEAGARLGGADLRVVLLDQFGRGC